MSANPFANLLTGPGLLEPSPPAESTSLTSDVSNAAGKFVCGQMPKMTPSANMKRLAGVIRAFPSDPSDSETFTTIVESAIEAGEVTEVQLKKLSQALDESLQAYSKRQNSTMYAIAGNYRSTARARTMINLVQNDDDEIDRFFEQAELIVSGSRVDAGAERLFLGAFEFNNLLDIALIQYARLGVADPAASSSDSSAKVASSTEKITAVFPNGHEVELRDMSQKSDPSPVDWEDIVLESQDKLPVLPRVFNSAVHYGRELNRVIIASLSDTYDSEKSLKAAMEVSNHKMHGQLNFFSGISMGDSDAGSMGAVMSMLFDGQGSDAADVVADARMLFYEIAEANGEFVESMHGIVLNRYNEASSKKAVEAMRSLGILLNKAFPVPTGDMTLGEILIRKLKEEGLLERVNEVVEGFEDEYKMVTSLFQVVLLILNHFYNVYRAMYPSSRDTDGVSLPDAVQRLERTVVAFSIMVFTLSYNKYTKAVLVAV